jgi:hypothetical protein
MKTIFGKRTVTTFSDEALEEGYEKPFVDHLSYYKDVSQQTSRSSTGPNHAVKSREIKQYLTSLQGSDPDTALGDIRDHLKNLGDLSRVDMEVVARLTNKFCYSACVATSAQFKADVYDDLEFQNLGTLLRPSRGLSTPR